MKPQGGAGARGVRSTCYVTEFPFSTGNRGVGVSFLSLSLFPSPTRPLARPPPCLPSQHSLYIKPQPWKTRAEPSQPRAVGTGGRGGGEKRCWERASKEVTSGCGLRLRLGTYVYVQTTGLCRLCLLGLIESVVSSCSADIANVSAFRRDAKSDL